MDRAIVHQLQVHLYVIVLWAEAHATGTQRGRGQTPRDGCAVATGASGSHRLLVHDECVISWLYSGTQSMAKGRRS